MGLTTNNYVSKSTGIVLPVAYAVLKTVAMNENNKVRATFFIQANRENAQKYKPLDVVEVYFEWDRKKSLAEMAYEQAKKDYKVITKYKEDGEPVEVFEYGTLYGWTNNIV